MMNSSGAAGFGSILDGLEVVEIATNIAGPFAGKLLAENGAHVVKVEPPWGAPFRNRRLWYDTAETDDYTYRFLQYNDGKESIAIDLKTEEGKRILWELLENADVFIENASAGTLADLGFPWEELQNRNPELIYCSITGYGESGSFADKPAYDTVIQGVSGLVHKVGDLDDPETIGIAMLDHTTGLYSVIGILLALVHRGISGDGQKVEIAMVDIAVSLLGHVFAEYSASLNDSDVTPRYDSHFEPATVYKCKDDYAVIIVMPEVWAEFAEAIDKPEFTAEESQFATNAKRVSNAGALKKELEAVLQHRTVAEWIEYFSDAAPNVAIAPVSPIENVTEAAIVQERGLAVERSNSELGDYVTPRPAIRFSNADMSARDVPRLGEHSASILRSFGYSVAEIEELMNSGVIEGASGE